MDPKFGPDRRTVLVGAALLAAGTARAAKREEEVPAVEDLMREHGLLRRILLVYDEVRRRLGAREDVPPDVVPGAADLVRRFVEDYHERQEEQSVFPRFEKAGKLTELVAVLRLQHQRGRELTDRALRLGAARTDADRRALDETLRLFTAMYRPHAAREDTVLFPAFAPLVGDRAYVEIGEHFEEAERSMFGKDGFEKIRGEVEGLEQALGIADLARFTPPA
jgi:hemerythrin-like domain-containing protein